MCGFTGFYSTSYSQDSSSILNTMCKAINHRGPDGKGIWSDEDSGIYFGHQRLAIVDLSSAGHQPMVSACGQYIIVFNGEIYNHSALRDELRSIHNYANWRGHSDTETLLASFELFGLELTLQKCIGMFAIAIWDKKDKSLILARDRVGEKPLYYGFQGNKGTAFIFGSELKALKQHPSFEGNIDRSSLALQMRHGYIPTPYCIYKGIHKLKAGHFVKFSASDLQNGHVPESIPFWSLTDAVKNGKLNPLELSDYDAINSLDSLLKSAVKQQMMSDVPLGAFLSGGVDSSTIVALMQEQSKNPIKTFSIGFNEQCFNEAVYAKSVANYLGTDHTELYVDYKTALDVIPNLPHIFDEPFSDSSQIPTFLVSKLAKKNVTVSLSGDAGDELFCGYNRYMLTQKLWKKLSLFPVSIRKVLSRLITKIPVEQLDKFISLLPINLNYSNIGDKLHKGAGLLDSSKISDLYMGMVSQWLDVESLVINSKEYETIISTPPPNFPILGNIEQMMLLDGLTYLTDDILTKVDRASMSVSLESRVPFLDHRVIEFAWKLPLNQKLKNGKSKWILREVLYKYVPKELIERPKMGFGVPIAVWLRGPLKDWADDLLSESRLSSDGFFNCKIVRQKWEEHLSGKRNWHYQLWNVLCFQAWYENEKKLSSNGLLLCA